MKVAIGHIPLTASDKQLEALEQYWRRLVHAGTHKARFHAGGVNSSSDFIEAVLAEGSMCFLVYDAETGIIYGECTLNNFMGKTAQIHFSVLPEFYRQVVGITLEVLKLIFQLKDLEGRPAVTALIGITPLTNRLAVKFIQKVGFKHIITVPDMCNVHGQIVPGFVTLLVREGV